jgi:NTP pyrophosphatase (non-canonical NTP hydrolase)
MLSFNEYQEQAKFTDQRPEIKDAQQELIPLLGLFGEIGSVAAEYKKHIRDKSSYKQYQSKLSEELGDVLWYIATIANDSGLNLEEIASNNIKKINERWAIVLPKNWTVAISVNQLT